MYIIRAIARMTSASLLLISSAPALASEEVTASNGVIIKVNSDTFSDRYEYTAPVSRIEGGGFYIVASIKKGGVAGNVFITGSIFYDGDWRYYDKAVYRGGEVAPALFSGRKVVSCAGSRYGGCTLSEGFQIEPTDAQIKENAENGFIPIQISASGIYPIILNIPLNYIEAVKEVGK